MSSTNNDPSADQDPRQGILINQYQLMTSRKIAQQKIEQALQEFARQLPQGLRYLQEAINAAGAILDHMERETGQYEAAAAIRPPVPANQDLAGERVALAGVEESDTFQDFDQS